MTLTADTAYELADRDGIYEISVQTADGSFRVTQRPFGFGEYIANWRDDNCPTDRNGDACRCGDGYAWTSESFRHCHDGTEICELCWLAFHQVHSVRFHMEIQEKYGDNWIHKLRTEDYQARWT